MIAMRTVKTSMLATVIMASLIAGSVFVFMTATQYVYSQELNFSTVNVLPSNDRNDVFHNYQTIASGDSLYMVWEDNSSGKGDIFFAKSTDNGQTFDIVNLSRNVGESRYPQIAALDDQIYVVWQDNSSGNKEILFSKSVDGGVSFSDPVNLSNNSGDSEFPHIAVSSSNVYVVWRDNTLGNYDILIRTSNDSGVAFNDISNLSKNAGDSIFGNRVKPIVALNSNVYVGWHDYSSGNGEILLARSVDKGITFDDAVNISNTSGFSNHATLAASGSSVYVVWLDDTHHGGFGADYDVFFSRSVDNGASFSIPTNISGDGGTGVAPTIALSNNYVYVVWFAGTSPNFDVFFSRSVDNGASFHPAINLSNNSGISSNPQIAALDDQIYVVWQDNIAANGDIAGNWDVYLRTSTNAGAEFGDIVNLSSNEGQSHGPQVVTSVKNIHVIWRDHTLGTADLFLRTGTQ